MAKTIRLSVWHLTVVFCVLYITLVVMVYNHLEKTTTAKASSGQVFKPRIGEDGSIDLFVKECPKTFVPKRSTQFRSGAMSVPKDDTCPVNLPHSNTTIQMENLWSSVSVNYPQYVYTLSGWIQVIDVPNYNPKPLRVIIVPHSHQDPGWLETFEGYYSSYTTQTLNNIVTNLSKNPTWKFIWSEVAFLEKWFSDPLNPISKFKRLVANGQLEIVTGGWVMTDEAVTHFSAMLDQLIEGHLWLKSNLGITPNVSWSVDPFGHSPTMPYLLKQAGIDRMIIQRVHFAIKRHLAQRQQLEFHWRQAWDSGSTTDVLCHMMPFLLYAIYYSCGPEPHVCCQFDFYREQCHYGNKRKPVVPVSQDNINKLSWSLWEQLQKKSQLYQSNVLLVPHGDDFRYTSQHEWDAQFGNLAKLMKYMNENADMNIKIEFGTISDYFNALKEDTSKTGVTFPSFSGDFLPYNDRDDQYWTGFYTTRPWHKHMSRVLQAKLRVGEIVLTMGLAHPLLAPYIKHSKILSALVSVRRALALFQHHDAITGTSRKSVMADYRQKLLTARRHINDILAVLVLYWMASSTLKYETLKDRLDSVMFLDGVDPGNVNNILRETSSGSSWYIVVMNPHTIDWVSPVTVRTRVPSVIITQDGMLVPSQCNPVFGSGMKVIEGVYDVVFFATMSPLSMRTYQVVDDAAKAYFTTVTVFGSRLTTNDFRSDFKASKSTKPVIEIENDVLKASVSSCTGLLQSTFHKAEQLVFRTEVKMMTYGIGSWSNPFRDSSGAYIFMPRGHAQDLEIYYPNITVLKGHISSTVISELHGVRHSVTLYNIKGPLGAGLHIDNFVDISSPGWDNKELVMRIETNVHPQKSDWCVDLNGYQMHRKKYRSKFTIQGNFHPMTSMVFIEDDDLSRISLLSSYTHGASTQNNGWLEVILDRRLMQDDWRGLNQGVTDNVPVSSSFILLPEKGTGLPQSGPVCRPSLLAHLLSNHLNNPQQVAAIEDSWQSGNLKPSKSLIEDGEAWPCDTSLLNLKNTESVVGMSAGEAKNWQETVKALMVLHRTAIDCNFPQILQKCEYKTSVDFGSLGSTIGITVLSAVETSLTGTSIKGSNLESFVASLDSMDIKTYSVGLGPS